MAVAATINIALVEILTKIITILFLNFLTFGGEKTEDPIEFVYQFENFLRYISHNVEDPASVEKTLTYLGQCLSSKTRLVSNSYWTPKNS